MLRVVIDPGHTEDYNGGVAPGYYEGNKVFTLAKYLKEELERDTDQVEAILTKANLADNPGLYARGQKAVSEDAAIFLSLHTNAVGDRAKYEKAYGVSVYRSLFLPDSEDLGNKIADAVVAVMSPVTGVTYSRGVLTREGNNGDYYGVIRGAVSGARSKAAASKGPVKHAFIIEHGFHTNSKECAFLNNDENLRKIAKAEAVAIKEHYGIVGDKESHYTGLSIMGEAQATEVQLKAYLLNNNPEAVAYLDLPGLYLEEGKAEGVRGDAAFCMACKETGFFRYGGDVKPEQNNYCGLGATGGGVAGASFATKRLGVRANIQHLKAYGSTEALVNECIDPRFKYVTRGKALTFEELAGKWAVPGYNTKKYTSLKAAMDAKDAYGHNIVNMLALVLTIGETEAPKEEPKEDTDNKVIGTIKVIYEGADGLDVHKTTEWGSLNLNNVNGPVFAGSIFRVTEKVKVGNGFMYKLFSGAGYITASEKYVTFTPTATEEKPQVKEIKAGDTVKVIKNVTYTGKSFKTWYDKYTVLSISGDRAVIGIGKTVTAAVNVKDIAVA